MKKILVAALAVSAASSMAVVKPYVGASVGYTLGQPSGVLGTDATSSSPENIYGTYAGKAIPLGVHAGVIDNDVVGAQLDLSYLLGQEQDISKQTDYKIKSTLTGVLLTPSIVVAAKGPFTPYAKFGLVFGFGLTDEQKVDGAKIEYTGGTAFGFEGALGGEFKVQERLGLTVELAAQSLKWAPTDAKITGNNLSKSYTLEDDGKSDGDIESLASATGSTARKPVYDLSNLAIKVGFNYHM